jgi:oxygen-independent coproporphyrinogen-3 oxidase
VLGLYLHVPFCQAICHYCNFNRGLLDTPLKTRYVQALRREVVLAGDGHPVDTVFFGGGTPSLLDPSEVELILDACRQGYDLAVDAEITLEANPETVTVERLDALRRAGVNRLSFGVQSFHDEELARLGRIHSSARAAEVVSLARRAGFTNVNLDLMCWLPGQSVESWRETVDRAIALEPDHISFYLLELYSDAPLKGSIARRSGRPARSSEPPDAWQQVDEDSAADMYLDGMGRLDRAGFVQYEISNTAKPGRQSRHNLKYWTMGSWRGFGCGAHSTVDAKRWRNVASTAEYVALVEAGQAVERDVREIPLDERGQEAVFTGLRLSSGIDTGWIDRQYRTRLWKAYGDNFAAWMEAGLMWRDGSRLGLTRQGMLVSNEVLVNFV